MSSISDKRIKACWESWGGDFPGVNADSCAIEKSHLYLFAREMYRRGVQAGKDIAVKQAGKKIKVLSEKALTSNLEAFTDSLAEAYEVGVEEAQGEIIARLERMLDTAKEME